MTWLAVGVFVVAYGLIASDKVSRVAIALAGGAVLLAVGGSDQPTPSSPRRRDRLERHLPALRDDGHRRRPAADRRLRVPRDLVGEAGRGQPVPGDGRCWSSSPRSPRRCLDNVTTVLLVAPVTLLVCERLGVTRCPFLIAEVLASNIGGTATLVGDPPNIIIASRAGLAFNDFLVHLAPIVVVCWSSFVGLCRVAVPTRSSLRPRQRGGGHGAGGARGDPRPPAARPAAWSCSPWSSPASSLHTVLHSSRRRRPAGRRAAGLVSRLSTADVPGGVEWETLLFFAGLFIMVGALVKTGVIGELARRLSQPRRQRCPAR